ncbi:fumarylacetoacetate hydrolase family protein [Nocardia sp. NPDC004750]
MHLATYHDGNRLTAAFAVDGQLVDAALAARECGIDDSQKFLTVRGIVSVQPDVRARVYDSARQLVNSGGSGLQPASNARLAPPVPDPDKIICLGLNYRDHAAETAQEIPSAPMLFAKFNNSLLGHGEPIRLPLGWSENVDYEGEIAVVIGTALRSAKEEDALAAVAGWMPFNDVSARDLQLLTPQWTAGKAIDGFGPCGPFLTVDDGALAENSLELCTRLNGETVQRATVGDMIFSVAHTLSFLSSFMTLVPGDIVVTGTPAGIGMSREPQRFLREGDLVEVQVGDCVLSNPVLGPQVELPTTLTATASTSRSGADR